VIRKYVFISASSARKRGTANKAIAIALTQLAGGQLGAAHAIYLLAAAAAVIAQFFQPVFPGKRPRTHTSPPGFKHEPLLTRQGFLQENVVGMLAQQSVPPFLIEILVIDAAIR
jgi:hypothetical protein